MSKQIVEEKNTANDLNQALKGAVKERDEGDIQVYSRAIYVNPNDK